MIAIQKSCSVYTLLPSHSCVASATIPLFALF
jgi:hypothetical protein